MKMLKKTAASFIAAGLLAASPIAPAAIAGPSAEEAAHFNVGLDVGADIPAVSEVNAKGEPVTLNALMGENGVTLAFVRSANWCPFCKQQMIQLNDIAADLSAAGYPLVVLSYDAPTDQARFVAANGLSYAFISDEDSSVIKAFGLLDESYKPGSKPHGVPHPVVYKIGVTGQIEGKLLEESFRLRPTNEAVLELVTDAAG